jgi:hypothetical protein
MNEMLVYLIMTLDIFLILFLFFVYLILEVEHNDSL